MKIPHDPVALEEHFRDDDEGPVSNQGYMPYLNRFILDKVSISVGVQTWHLCGTGLWVSAYLNNEVDLYWSLSKQWRVDFMKKYGVNKHSAIRCFEDL